MADETILATLTDEATIVGYTSHPDFFKHANGTTQTTNNWSLSYTVEIVDRGERFSITDLHWNALQELLERFNYEL